MQQLSLCHLIHSKVIKSPFRCFAQYRVECKLLVQVELTYNSNADNAGFLAAVLETTAGGGSTILGSGPAGTLPPDHSTKPVNFLKMLWKHPDQLHRPIYLIHPGTNVSSTPHRLQKWLAEKAMKMSFPPKRDNGCQAHKFQIIFILTKFLTVGEQGMLISLKPEKLYRKSYDERHIPFCEFDWKQNN